MSHGLVSVGIPLYNAEGFIQETISSVIGQTYSDIEVLVIDDGSTDQSYEAAAAFSDPRVRIIRQENQGVCRARNVGAAAAQGDAVYFLDADDLLHPEAIRKRLEAMWAEGCGASYSRIQHIDGAGAIKRMSNDKSPSGNVYFEMEKLFLFDCGSNCLVSRAALEKIRLQGIHDGYFQPRWLNGCEDWEFGLRVAAVTGIVFVPEILLSYRRFHNDSGRSRSLSSMNTGYHVLMELIADDWFLSGEFTSIRCT